MQSLQSGSPLALVSQTLPVDEIVVLEARFTIVEAPLVGLGELAPKDAQRAFVGQDVVQNENHERVLARAFVERQKPNQGAGLQVEGSARLAYRELHLFSW